MQRKQAKIHKRDGRWVATYFVTHEHPYRHIEDITVPLVDEDQTLAWMFNDGIKHTIELVDCVPADRAPGGWSCSAKIITKGKNE